MKLPQRLPLDQMQVNWASIIEPVISNPANNSIILPNVTLAVGTNIISHRLGTKLAGWKTTRVRAATTIYDIQDQNSTPQLTLLLVASAPAVVDLEVFA